MRLRDPRAIVLSSALVIEGASLCLWPAVYLSDSSDVPTRLGSIFLVRYPVLGEALAAIKGFVDWWFPGTLWAWEHVVAFVFQCVMVTFVAYAIAAWRLVSAKPVGLRWILLPMLAFQLTLAVVPASMTTDIFNYAIYGEMPVLYGANPFIHTPSEFPQSPLYYLIPLYWHDAPSVYGPLWVMISVGVASLFHLGSLADELLFYRLIANAAHLVNAILVWQLARRIGTRAPAAAVLAYGWNPLLLVDFGLNGHNDVLMLTLLLGAFLAGTYRRVSVAAALLGLSVAAKYTTVLVAPLLLASTALGGIPTNTRERWRQALLGPDRRRLLFGAAIVAAVPIVFYAPWFEGLDTLGPVLRWMSGPVLNNYWPEAALTSFAHGLAESLEASYDDVWRPILEVAKLAAKVGLVALIGFEAWRLRTVQDALAGSARIFIFFLLVVTTWVMPWYYSWPLAIAAPLGWGSLTVRVCAGLTLTAMVSMYQRQMGHFFVTDGAWFLILPIIISLVPSAIGRLRWHGPKPRVPNRVAVERDVEPEPERAVQHV
jgi:hypothetical protein